MVCNVVALDCSQEAQHGFILYRGGAAFNRNHFMVGSQPRKLEISVSYGMSLYAGALYEPTATVSFFEKRGRSVCAIIIPFTQAQDPLCPYYIPSQINTLYQLIVGEGEMWHARTKIPTSFLCEHYPSPLQVNEEEVLPRARGGRLRMLRHSRPHINGLLSDPRKIAAQYPSFFVDCSTEEILANLEEYETRGFVLCLGDTRQQELDAYVVGERANSDASCSIM